MLEASMNFIFHVLLNYHVEATSYWHCGAAHKTKILILTNYSFILNNQWPNLQERQMKKYLMANLNVETDRKHHVNKCCKWQL
jgi:hypothetical protein